MISGWIFAPHITISINTDKEARNMRISPHEFARNICSGPETFIGTVAAALHELPDSEILGPKRR